MIIGIKLNQNQIKDSFEGLRALCLSSTEV
ncbi:MAG: hypothetical protein ACI9DJ_002522 [Algoriphagus sp.]|jgi:hypothetical protein